MELDSSGSFRLVDLDDFNKPSQDCIKELITKPTGLLRRKADKPQAVKITLSDCLSCSGCLTSAESLLVSEQGWETIYKTIKSLSTQKKQIVVSLSEQSLASICCSFDIESSFDLVGAIEHLLNQAFGEVKIRLLKSARQMVIERLKEEFGQRWKSKIGLPMLSSTCPGWICYAEKTQQTLLPFISSVRSPQQTSGLLLSEKTNGVYHLAVMPCYDNKLECSRPDFQRKLDDGTVSRDVDAVLTTEEIISMMKSIGSDSTDVKTSELMSRLKRTKCLNEDNDGSFPTHADRNRGCGGYLEAIMAYFASSCLRLSPSEYIIEEKPIRGVNLVERKLINNVSGETFCFLYAYGFRSIYHVVQKMKAKKCSYLFIEVMACPGGCITGNGQLNSTLSNSCRRELLLNYDRFCQDDDDRRYVEESDMKTLDLSTSYTAVDIEKKLNW